MKESDYLELAKKQTDFDLLESFWYKVLREEVWYSKDGTKTPFDKLSFKHISHIVNGLLDFRSPACKLIIKKLLNIFIERTEFIEREAIEANIELDWLNYGI